jgi:hypothetical protein
MGYIILKWLLIESRQKAEGKPAAHKFHASIPSVIAEFILTQTSASGQRLQLIFLNSLHGVRKNY